MKTSLTFGVSPLRLVRFAGTAREGSGRIVVNRPHRPTWPQRIRWGCAIILLTAMAGCDSPSVGDAAVKSPEPEQGLARLTTEELANADLETQTVTRGEFRTHSGLPGRGDAESSCVGGGDDAGARPGGGGICGSRATGEERRAVGHVVQ